MPVKVYDLAKEFKISNTEMVKSLAKMGFERLSPSSDLDDETAGKVRAALSAAAGAGDGDGSGPAAANGATAAAPAAAPANGAARSAATSGGGAAPAPTAGGSTPAPAAGTGETIELPANITVKELGERFGVPASEVQKVLMGLGVLAAVNQRLAGDAIRRIAQKMGKTVRIAGGEAAPAAPAAPTPTAPATAGTNGNGAAATAPARPANGTAAPAAPAARTTGGPGTAKPAAGGGSKAVAVKGRAPQDAVTRPPVVTIMGHVDHGKTTLLDSIRKADVVSGEAGGITQHIGAYQVEANGQRITFIDTPGHAAFSAMRNRGASVTDIIVIVVAADDSVMPQTEEAIRIAKESGLPIIVAVNKIDLPDANPDRVLTDLTRYDIVPEAYGGDVPTVNISAKAGTGIQDLLDSILLVSEVIVDPKADPHGKAQGTVIEAKTEKGRGAVATVLVQQGTLLKGDMVVAGTFFGRIRTMNDDKGGALTKAGPSTPVEIIGLSGVPDAGERIVVAKDEREARALAAERDVRDRDERLGGRNLVSLEALYHTLRVGETKELNVVIKGDVQGSVQAVRDALLELGNEEVRTRVLLAGVGPVSESDILLASSDKDADASNSLVVAFNIGTAPGVDKKAEQEHVTIRSYTIIYELIDAVRDAMIALLPPVYEEVNLGKATVRALFNLPGGRKIAGTYVTDGLVRRNAKARLFRGTKLLYTGDIDTLKRFKDDAREVAAGYECGLTLRDWNDVIEGDNIECFELRQVPREL
jgi:translation initiation factor IF-2